jgi:hypothetical protein
MISLFLFTLFCFGAYASVPRSLNFGTAVGPDGEHDDKVLLEVDLTD